MHAKHIRRIANAAECEQGDNAFNSGIRFNYNFHTVIGCRYADDQANFQTPHFSRDTVFRTKNC
jgi:hypothetical protein